MALRFARGVLIVPDVQPVLADLRVVAIEQYGAGPFATLHLADLGAEVIKIEDPKQGGDFGRYVPPHGEDEDNLFFETFNRNKRSLSLDIESAAGREVLEDLVRVSDVVFSNLRGDLPARLRIRYDDLAPFNPRIVCASLSGFGMTGPRYDEPGYDYVLQGLAGWMALTGDPDGPPTKSGISLVDFSAGVVATAAILAGVHAARRNGLGMDCDVSLYDTAMSMLTYLATWHLTAGHEPARQANSAHPSLVPFQAFQAADGWVVVGCAKEKFWARLCGVLHLEGLVDDSRFVDFAARHTNRHLLLPILDDAFLRRPVKVWVDLCRDAQVPCAPVRTVPEALRDAQLSARELVVETVHPRFGTVRSLASPVRVGSGRRRHTCAPRRNESAPYVLHDLLGYEADRVEMLAAGGAFGDVGSSTVSA
jgi:crotonobetainyl-CoA:carnitine CoA-transferase CaiB-like acyl-CoA transferase